MNAEALFTKAIAGFAGASIATATASVDVAESIIPRWLMEGGSGVALVGCLIYAVSNLWKANQSLQRDIRETLESQNKAIAKELSDAVESRKRLEIVLRKGLKVPDDE